MQYVPGRSLQARVDEDGPLAVEEILRIGMQAAAGLAAAHAQGLVHRDVKPSNILLEETVERAVLTDFGLARAIDDASLTHTGVLAGTPHYMSPEQATGAAIDHRSDLFSLGAVLYFMATGHPPFRADGALAVLHRICHEEHRPVWQTNKDDSGRALRSGRLAAGEEAGPAAGHRGRRHRAALDALEPVSAVRTEPTAIRSAARPAIAAASARHRGGDARRRAGDGFLIPRCYVALSRRGTNLFTSRIASIARAVEASVQTESQFASELQATRGAVEWSEREPYSASPVDFEWRQEIESIRQELTKLESTQGISP